MSPAGCSHVNGYKVDNWKQNLRVIYQCFVWSGTAETRRRKVKTPWTAALHSGKKKKSSVILMWNESGRKSGGQVMSHMMYKYWTALSTFANLQWSSLTAPVRWSHAARLFDKPSGFKNFLLLDEWFVKLLLFWVRRTSFRFARGEPLATKLNLSLSGVVAGG